MSLFQNVNSENQIIDGALLVNKPPGLTSAEVIRQLKRSHQFSKIGHSGTLDPMATGLLIILIGKATRLQDELLKLAKCYSGKIRLGYATSTDDITGDELLKGKPLSEDSFSRVKQKLLAKFSGEIQQRPPVYSAMKVKGKRAYKIAREGGEVNLPPRPVQIYSFDLDWLSEDQLTYEIECSSGFYVRSLARDIGEELGTLACLESIERTSIGDFELEDSTSFEQLLEPGTALPVIGMASLVSGLPFVELTHDDCQKLKQGKQSILANLEFDSEEAGPAAIFSTGGELCALVERKAGDLGGSLGAWKIRAVFYS